MSSTKLTKQAPLCKLSFDIDDSHHELPLFANSSLHGIVDELAQTLEIQTIEDRQLLKEEVSARIHNVMKENGNASPEWKSKLTKILKGSPRKKITYFGYGRDGDSSYARIKKIHQFLADQEHSSNKTTSRLEHHEILHPNIEDNNKQSQTLAKEEIKKDLISECTFHPMIRAHRSSNKAMPLGSVFQRLYQQAENKQAKRKRIQKQVIEREETEIRQLSFIPNINKCSREIVRTKNQVLQTEISEEFNRVPSTSGKIIHQNSNFKQPFKKQHKQNLFFHEIKHETLSTSKDKSPAAKSRLLQQKSINQPTNRRPTNHTKSQRVSTCTSQPVLQKKFLKKNIPKFNKKQLNHYWIDESQLKKQKYVIEQKDEAEERQKTKQAGAVSRTKGNFKNPFQFFQIQEQTLKNKQAVSESHLTYAEKESNIEINFEERKNNVFETIFKVLAKNSEEVSSKVLIESGAIPPNIKHIFLPMAEEMQNLGVGLDKQEFTWSVSRIFDTLSLPDRGYLLAWGMGLPASIR